MKTKLILTTLMVIFMFAFSSCKKADINPSDVTSSKQTNNSTSLAGNKTGQMTNKGGTVLYQATSANIAAFESAFYSSISGTGGSGRPPACAVLQDQASMLTNVYVVGGNICNGDAIFQLTYEWLVYEGAAVADPSISTFGFTITDGASNVYTPTVTGSSQTPFNCNPILNPCSHLFTYQMTINMPQAAFIATTTTTNKVSGVGPGGCSSTTTVTKSVGLTDCGFYLNNPARVYPTPDPSQPGTILIFTDCSLFNCWNLLFQCPTGGTLDYRVPGTTGWPNPPVTLGPNGGFKSGLISNQPYEYQCTLNYSYTGCSGSSQLKTGTFTPN